MENGKVKKLHLLKRLLKNQLDTAATKYSTSARLLTSELNKQQQLQTYKQHYHQDLFKSNNPTVNINTIKQKTVFIQYIDGILKTQETSITAIKNDVDFKKNVWLHFRNKFNKLSDYITDMEDQYKESIESREQKELDTMVNDLYDRNKDVEM